MGKCSVTAKLRIIKLFRTEMMAAFEDGVECAAAPVNSMCLWRGYRKGVGVGDRMDDLGIQFLCKFS